MNDWNAMQNYERESGLHWLRENWPSVLADYERNKERGQFLPPLDFYLTDKGIDTDAFQGLLTHIAGKTILEVGCGPSGCIPLWAAHVGTRVLIDPLLDEYRDEVSRLVGLERSWFTPDIMYFATRAENDIPALHGQVNGMILCRNTLDHCDQPFVVLDRLSSYAARGSWLLLWTDLYWRERDERFKGTNGIPADDGHRNICESREAFEKELRSRGWRICKTFSVRQPPYIDWGGIAVMEA